jgi:hypothetical protein
VDGGSPPVRHHRDRYESHCSHAREPMCRAADHVRPPACCWPRPIREPKDRRVEPTAPHPSPRRTPREIDDIERRRVQPSASPVVLGFNSQCGPWMPAGPPRLDAARTGGRQPSTPESASGSRADGPSPTLPALTSATCQPASAQRTWANRVGAPRHVIAQCRPFALPGESTLPRTTS